MRSFFAISLALAAGCGDNLSGPLEGGDDGLPVHGADSGDLATRIVPQICGLRSWDSVAIDAKDMDLRAVGTPIGATVFMVPKAGGMLRGFNVDGRGMITGDQAGMKIRSDAMFTGLSAARIDDRNVVALAYGDSVIIDAISDDLTQYRDLTIADGPFVGDAPLMHSRNVRVAVTGGSNGLQLSQFDSAWHSMGSEALGSSVPTSMSSAEYGNDAMVVWSTDTECHLQRVAAGVESVQNFACPSSRVAVDYTKRGGWMVYEQGGSVMLSKIQVDGHNQIANSAQLARFGASPRIAFDGEHFWVSYVNFHGGIVVGILDDNGDLTSTAIEDMRPMHDAYDLGMVNGVPWAYGLDGSSIIAARFCTTNE